MKFNPDSPGHKKAAYIYLIIGTLCTVIGTVYLLWPKTETIVINKDNKEPIFEVIADTPYSTISYDTPILLYPDTLKINKELALDTNESIMFQYKKKINQKILKLKKIDKTSIDSLVSTIVKPPNKDIDIRLRFNLTVKNRGSKIAKVIYRVVSDSLTFDNFLIRNFLNRISDATEENKKGDEILIKPDSLKDIQFPRYIPLFFDSEKRFNVHLCVFYMDPDSNYYAMYRVIQYQTTKKEFAYAFYPNYKEIQNNIWAFDIPIVFAIPYMPMFKDLYTFIQRKEFMEYKLTDSERELLRKNYLRKKT